MWTKSVKVLRPLLNFINLGYYHKLLGQDFNKTRKIKTVSQKSKPLIKYKTKYLPF